MGVAGGDLDTPPVAERAGRGGEGAQAGQCRALARPEWGPWQAGLGALRGTSLNGWARLTPGTSHPSSEWPREPRVPLYVPKFQSGWEPPLDVLQEAPWEVEGLVSAPSDEVRAPTASHPTALPLSPPLPTALTTPAPPPNPAPTPRQAQTVHFSLSRLQGADCPSEAPRSTALYLSQHPQETSFPQSAPHIFSGKLPSKWRSVALTPQNTEALA